MPNPLPKPKHDMVLWEREHGAHVECANKDIYDTLKVLLNGNFVFVGVSGYTVDVMIVTNYDKMDVMSWMATLTPNYLIVPMGMTYERAVELHDASNKAIPYTLMINDDNNICFRSAYEDLVDFVAARAKLYGSVDDRLPAAFMLYTEAFVDRRLVVAELTRYIKTAVNDNMIGLPLSDSIIKVRVFSKDMIDLLHKKFMNYGSITTYPKDYLLYLALNPTYDRSLVIQSMLSYTQSKKD